MVHKAGGLIFSSTGSGHVLLLYRTRKRDWSFPKGLCEQGESVEEAMHREVLEETGLRTRVIHELPLFRYRMRRNGMVTCHFFLTQSLDDRNLTPEYVGDYLQWFPIGRVELRLTHDNVRRYWRQVLPQVATAAREIH